MNKPLLIRIIGTHGTGKTTLSYKLAAHYKEQGKNVKIVQEVARSCPFPINEGMTKEAALWIYHEHSKKELEACKDHEVVICDRSPVDSFIYAEHFQLETDSICLDDLVCRVIQTSSFIFFVRPDCKIIDDGVRSNDIEFQNRIDQFFKAWFIDNILTYFDDKSRMLIKNKGCPSNLKLIKSSQIFDKEESWKKLLI